MDVGGRYAGTATGFVNMVGNMGNSLQPLVGAAVFTHFGWHALFACYAGGVPARGEHVAVHQPESNVLSGAAGLRGP